MPHEAPMIAVIIIMFEFRGSTHVERKNTGTSFCQVEIRKHIIHESIVENTLINQW